MPGVGTIQGGSHDKGKKKKKKKKYTQGRDQRMATSCSARFLMVRVMFHSDCVGRRQVPTGVKERERGKMEIRKDKRANNRESNLCFLKGSSGLKKV